MPLFSKDSKLYDAIFCDPSLLPVLDRFGITLGVGDATIEDICFSHDLNPDFLLAVINTFLNDDYFPEAISHTFKISALIDFLAKTNEYYSREQLPNIERHFNLLLQRSHDKRSLQSFFNFFLELKADLLECDRLDTEHWFPYIYQKSEDTIYANDSICWNPDLVHALPDGLSEAFLSRDAVEDKIADLESLFILHLHGDYDKTLCLAVINAIFMLHKDIRQNNRIRNRILLPIVGRLFL
ncbi:MAG: hypothetical protein NC097_03040 [Clostridium sp.]|nr:helix-turn-helix transcriptional regulator [Prevotella sp.]MCM1428751.1 hypothetical protein [Clostridium sp.]MCM1475126.1 helix-turn-helix transcriptional regulator [Muribaculaceae bacterium]